MITNRDSHGMIKVTSTWKPDYGTTPDHLRPLYRALLTNPLTGKQGSIATQRKAALIAQAGEA